MTGRNLFFIKVIAYRKVNDHENSHGTLYRMLSCYVSRTSKL